MNIGLAAPVAKGVNAINWNKPVPMVDRLVGDKYILPEGWQEATKGVKELVFYNSGGLAGDIATAINMELFQKKTGIKVTAIGVSVDPYLKTLTSLVSKDGSVPLLLSNTPWKEMSAYSATKQLVPIDYLFPTSVQKIYNPTVKEHIYRNGHWYGGIETAYNEGLIFYRPSWLKKAGVAVPTTYQELLEAAKKVRAWAKANVSPDAYGVTFGATTLEYPVLFQLLVYSQGGSIFKNGRARFVNNPAVKNALEFTVEAIKSDAASMEVLNENVTDMGLTFGSGKAGFLVRIMTSYARKFETDYPVIKDDWAIISPLKWDAKTPDKYRAAILGSNGGIINKYAGKGEQAAAALFLDFLRSKEAAAYEIVVEGNESLIPQYYDDDIVKLVDWDLADSVANALGIAKPIRVDKIPYKEYRRQTVIYGRNEAFSPGFPAVEKELTNQLNNLISGKVTIDQALKALQKFSDSVEN
jgi:ABC-type glycerol-3-phosphate transport system substrate-binding protein